MFKFVYIISDILLFFFQLNVRNVENIHQAQNANFTPKLPPKTGKPLNTQNNEIYNIPKSPKPFHYNLKPSAPKSAEISNPNDDTTFSVKDLKRNFESKK